MASRVKEDEKNERAIRELLKLPANRRCINCNSLGPQYVCTNFWTFICINCSGIHREFTHRVKSISMAKFSSEEVSSLQQGGNECAKEIYFKEWDAQRYSFPDSSNIGRLREFIKHVYMDRRYTGERSSSRSPRSKGDNEDPYDKKKLDSYHGSRSPTYSDMDVRRDDISRKNHQIPGGQKLEGRSPSQQKDIDISKSPVTQPIGAVINIPPASYAEQTKSTGIQDELTKVTGLQFPHNSPQIQSTVSGSSVGISAELKVVSSGSLIDFDADPGPHTVRATEQSITHQTTALPAEGGGWASFDDSSSLKLTQVTSMGRPAESFLSQLSVPQIAATANPSHSVVAGTISLSNQSNPMQWSTGRQNHPSLFEVPNVGSNPPFSTSISGASENPVSPIVRGLASVTGQSSQVVNTPNHQSTTGISQQPTNAVARPGTRKELPLDLFTMTYPSSLGPFPYYQTPQPYVGYGMQVQYPSSIAMPTYSLPLTPANPFALAEEPRLVHASTFPNLAPLQAALPNVYGHSLIPRTSSLPTQQWFAQQQTPMSTVPQGAFSSVNDHSSFLRTSSFPIQQWMPPQQIPMPTVPPRGPNVVQQGAIPVALAPSSSMFPAMHQTGGLNMEGLASNQHLNSRNYPSHTPTSSPGGNPFG